jgi:transcriptional antiterminator NusG
VTEQLNQTGAGPEERPGVPTAEPPGETAVQAAALVPVEPARAEASAPAGPQVPEAIAPEPPVPAAEIPAAEVPLVEFPAAGLEVPAGGEPAVAETESAVPEPPRKEPPAPRPRKKAAVVEAPAPEVPAEPKSENMDWFILKVQSNREDSIREALLRRVAIAGLDRFFGDVIVPTEKVTEFKGGKKRVIKRKLYPGYLVVHMEINEDTWFLVRETPGIGDFTGASGHPSPMLAHEVSRILAKQEEKSEKAPKLKIGFTSGERVKINEGTFENFEGEVESIDETNGRVTVMINIFGRSTPVELEYWQIEAV